MPDTNPYPVDSTLHHCCGGIGRHTSECPQVEAALAIRSPAYRAALPRHGCQFDWCLCTWPDDPGHWGVTYYPATANHRYDEAEMRVGVGVNYDAGQAPEVVIHIDGGPSDTDADVFLTPSEALDLLAALAEAVRNATAAAEEVASGGQ